MSTARKVLLWNYHIVWIERDLFGKPLESAGRGLSFLCMTGSHLIGVLAADKSCILNTLLSRFSKSTERPKAKKVSLERSFKTPDS